LSRSLRVRPMQRPVWILSLDSDTFPAAPMTTGGLKAYYQHYGQRAVDTDIRLVHLVNRPERISLWLAGWIREEVPRAQGALGQGRVRVLGSSVHTGEAAECLALMRRVKAICPGLLGVVGGPQVQKAQDELFAEGVDVVVLGEGEATLTDFL